MAKKDTDQANDPEAVAKKALEEKVDAYMDVSEPQASDPVEVPPVEAAEPEAAPEAMPAEDSALVDGAPPLLPTDKLPDLNAPSKVSKIKVVDHSEIEPEPIGQTEQTAAITEPTSDPEPLQPAAGLPLPEPSVSKDELGLEDVGMGKAVDEIIASEADEVLEAEDKKHAPVVPAASPSLGRKIKHFFAAWWRNKHYRNATLGLLAVTLLIAVLVPASRYALLNTVGVRASTSMTVLDDKTGLPLKNVELSLSNQTAKTDIDGYAKLEKIKLGRQNLSIRKPAFAEVNQQLTIGWGSNPKEDIRLKPVGSQYKFQVNDFLSGRAVAKAEALAGEASALSDEQGEIVLTVPEISEGDLSVQIEADGYRTETVQVAVGSKQDFALRLVPARKHAFVSKREGTLDVYKIDVDGKNEEKVLKGTGSEREDAVALAVHPDKDVAALVSTRDGSRNKDGYSLSVLTVIDLETNETKTLASSERIQLVDWIGDQLVYVKIAEGSSAASTTRHRLMSYNLQSASDKELASTNYFNDVASVRGSIYYSPAVYKVNGPVGLFRINADGTSKKTVFDKEVWNIFRTSFDKLSVSVGQDWYELNLDKDELKEVPAAPPQLRSRVYSDSPGGKSSLWVDERDGKGVLLVYDIEKRSDKTIASQSGIKTPIRWLSDKHIVYRVTNPQETADYVVNLEGGEARKIQDVTNTAGIDRWYYY